MKTPEFPRFQARAPWFGPDLQTIRNAIRAPNPKRAEPTEERLTLPLADGSGDALVGSLRRPAATAAAPLVVLIHGLSGCESSAYMRFARDYWSLRSHPVLRLNLRGAGPSRATCRLQYHAGRTEDLRDALHALDPALIAPGLVLIGHSLGGNMLLKFIAEFGRDFPIVAAASVSAPIDLAAASRRFLAPRNRFYQLHLLRSMKRESFGGAAELAADEQRKLLAARSVFEFDEHFVAPRNGYRDAEHYYRENHARQFLAGITVPTLLIHALDDPWIPAAVYSDYPWDDNDQLFPLLPDGGGHVGFHDRTSRTPWYNHCIGLFVEGLLGARRDATA